MKIYNDPVFEIKIFEAENVITASANDQTAEEIVRNQLADKGVQSGNVSTYVVGEGWE